MPSPLKSCFLYDYINKMGNLPKNKKMRINCKKIYLFYIYLLVTNELPKEKILNLIDDLVLYAKRQNMTISFHITGGDPILSKNFWEVLEAIKAKYHNIPITIMGNSYHVTETSIREMKKRGVLQYQISLDGLESAHDMIRKKGSFEDGIRALSIIHEQGLVAAVMFTVSRRNYKDFIPLYRYLDELGIVDNLALDRMTAIGNGRNESDELLLPEEYRDFLFSIYKFVAIERPAIVVNIKDNLWKLMLYELGLTLPIPQSKAQICNGCPVGKTICIMPDGEFFLCPRIPISVGKSLTCRRVNVHIKQFIVKKVLQAGAAERRIFSEEYLHNTIVEDSMYLSSFCFMGCEYLIGAIALVVLCALIAKSSIWLLLATLLWTPTILVISERASIKLKERDREILLLSDDLLGKIKILISSLEDIRINRLSGSLYSQFELESKRVLQAAMERDWVQIKSSSVVSLVRCIGNITFVIAGYALILTKHISVAQFIQTASLAGQLMAVAITVASAPAAMEPQTVHIMRLYQVINGLCCKKKENTCASIKMRPDGIAGDEITLKYGERTIFKNASFRTKKHGITAVIGENGRGKTSLFRIITGEMQISSGKITFYEEENVLTIDEENRSQYISVAQQIPTIYRATVIENLRLSEEAKECGDKQIKNLCKKVGVYDDIIRLPMGFDTYLSPSIKLSAGQKSKLQIVRCILRNKPIIMLDEPFANLDVTSKKQVADVLKEYANENVVLIATHDSIGGEIATQIIDINDMEDQGELKD